MSWIFIGHLKNLPCTTQDAFTDTVNEEIGESRARIVNQWIAYTSDRVFIIYLFWRPSWLTFTFLQALPALLTPFRRIGMNWPLVMRENVQDFVLITIMSLIFNIVPPAIFVLCMSAGFFNLSFYQEDCFGNKYFCKQLLF